MSLDFSYESTKLNDSEQIEQNPCWFKILVQSVYHLKGIPHVLGLQRKLIPFNHIQPCLLGFCWLPCSSS